MDLVSKIDEIIARRKIKAEAIQTRINFLEKLREKVSGLKKLQEVINFQMESKQGQYYALLGNDPIMHVNVSAIDAAFFIERLDRQLEVLKKMKARFGRESVCISVVGLARQGKSMLLQTITGLNDKVIPTSDGTDCTGAPSKIYNADAKKLGKSKVLAEIIFMNETEILDAVNSYTQKLFPEIRINSCTEIPALKDRLEELRKRCPGELEKFLHFEKYVIEYEEYSPFIGKTISCNDENEIITYVAQHNNPSVGESTIYYYKYLAVKSANIHCEFNYPEMGKIVLIDTIGIGDTALGIDKKMLNTISDDSDATILLRRPNPGGDNWNESDRALRNKLQENTLCIDEDKWLFVVINRQKIEKFDNTGIIEKFKGKVAELRKDALRCALLDDINISDRNELGEKLIYPMLKHLSENLDDIDSQLMRRANESGKSLYQNYYSLCNQVANVLSSSAKRNLQTGMKFEKLYDESLKLFPAIGKLVEEYHRKKELPCPEVKEIVDKKIKHIYDFVPSEKYIFERFELHRPEDHFANIYVLKSAETRTCISESFEEISLSVLRPLQENVKEEIIRILFDDKFGRLGKILLLGGTFNEASQKWMRTFMDEKLSDYPEMKAAFEFILDYHLSIDGFLEYQVESCLSSLDADTRKFQIPDISGEFGSEELMSNEKKAELVWQSIIDRLSDIQTELSKNFDTLISIPYHSFYARVRKFREKLIVSDKGRKELRSFYRENCFAIWQEEFMSITDKTNALGEWNSISADLREECKEDLFYNKEKGEK
jgi:hypothetical protein